MDFKRKDEGKMKRGAMLHAAGNTRFTAGGSKGEDRKEAHTID